MNYTQSLYSPIFMSWKCVQSPSCLCICLSHWKQIPEYLLYGAEREDVFSIGAGSWRAFWNHKIGGIQGIGEITVLDLGPVEDYLTFYLFEYIATQFYTHFSLVFPFKVSTCVDASTYAMFWHPLTFFLLHLF